YFLIDTVVFGQPAAQRPPGFLDMLSALRSRACLDHAKLARELEGAPGAGRTSHPDSPAHQLHDLGASRQAQTGSSKLAGDAAVGLFECFEYCLLAIWRNAHAGIRDSKTEGCAIGRIIHRDRTYCNGDRSRRGEFDGISQ